MRRIVAMVVLLTAMVYVRISHGQTLEEVFQSLNIQNEYEGSDFPWSPSCLFPDKPCPAPPISVPGGNCSICVNSFQNANEFSNHPGGDSLLFTYNVDAPTKHYPNPVITGYPGWSAFTPALPGPPGKSYPVSRTLEGGVFKLQFLTDSLLGAVIEITVDPSQQLDLNGDGVIDGWDGIPYGNIGCDTRAGCPNLLGVFAYPNEGNVPIEGMYAISENRGAGPAAVYLLFISEWLGKPRGVFVYVGLRGMSGGDYHYEWGFPNKESPWQKLPSTGTSVGGADYAYINADALKAGGYIQGCDWVEWRGCLSEDGKWYPIRVDGAGALKVASDRGLFSEPMPYGEQLTVYGFHVAVESAGPKIAVLFAKLRNLTELTPLTPIFSW